MRIFALLISLALFFPSFTSAQQFNLAERKAKVFTMPIGKEKANELNALSLLLQASSPDTAMLFAKEAASISQQFSYPIGMAKAHLQIANLQANGRHWRRAMNALQKGLPQAQSTEDLRLQMNYYRLMATVAGKQRKMKKLQAYQQQYLLLKDSLMNATAESQISVIEEKYLEQKEETQQTRLEKDEALLELQQQQELALRRELEITQLEMETAQLEMAHDKLQMEKVEQENEAMQKELELKEKIANRNLLIGAGSLLGLLLLGLWQRYRLIQQKKLAQIEKQRAERLEQVDRLKDQFLANTSHELRTPLNGIIGIAESLYDGIGEGSPEIQRENLAMVISSGKRLSNLVNDLLDLSKIKNDELTLSLKPVNMQALTEVVLRINESMARGKAIKLVNQLSPDLSAIKGDEDRLLQILHNLVGNAIKFTEKGEIEVMGKVNGAFLEIGVKDTGIGISRDKLESIFAEFSQADGSISRQYAGTGLGLSISKRLVEAHGGKMWVTSKVGEGSTFYFSIPISTEKASKKAFGDFISRPMALASPPTNGKAPKMDLAPNVGVEEINVLIVDDEAINQQVLRNHLSAPQFRITSAMNGEEALEAIGSGKKFDLVLLDLMMPRMSGYVVCQKIREQYASLELPIIMITAKNQVADLVEGLSYGANDYIAKPFSKEEFLARIRTHLNLHQINAATARFVPNEFLQTLGYDTITDVRLGDQVEREVTVFFSDIRAFTALSETMTPAENFRFVSAYASRMGPIISRHGGFVNQYMGDGIMALFQKNGENGIQAAIEMHQEIVRYNHKRKQQNRKPIRVGMGLHTGPLIMGIIGDKIRADATTISDTVNTASRMEGLTKFYGANLLVSEATLSDLEAPERFNYRYLGMVQAKGKSQSIGVYEFYDADPQELIDLKRQTHDHFEQGLRLYYAREFDHAKAAFEAVLAVNPKDRPASHYCQKAAELMTVDLPPDWDGVERMTDK